MNGGFEDVDVQGAVAGGGGSAGGHELVQVLIIVMDFQYLY